MRMEEHQKIRTVSSGLSSPLRPHEAAVLRGVLAGQNPAEAVRKAGLAMAPPNAKHYVEAIKARYLDAQGGLLVELDQVGVDLSSIAQTIKEGLEATKASKSGEKIIDKPDYATRHKYLETTLDIMGAKAPKHHIVEEIQTYDETVILVDKIRNNPSVLLKIQQRLESRQRVSEGRGAVIDVTPPPPAEGEEDGDTGS